jgi:hypothetical protein
MPEHIAINEATIAAVFEHVRREIHAELELDRGKKRVKFRRLLAEAVGQDEVDEYGVPEADSIDADMWDAMVERAVNRFAWDRDWEWRHDVVADRASMTLGAEGGRTYFAATAPATNTIPVSSILRGFSRIHRELREGEQHRDAAV